MLGNGKPLTLLITRLFIHRFVMYKSKTAESDAIQNLLALSAKMSML